MFTKQKYKIQRGFLQNVHFNIILVLPSGKQYTLLNIPFYYAECLDEVIEKTMGN